MSADAMLGRATVVRHVTEYVPLARMQAEAPRGGKRERIAGTSLFHDILARHGDTGCRQKVQPSRSGRAPEKV